MRAKSPKKVELPEKVAKLLEEAYIAGWHLGPLSAKAFSEEFKGENPLVYVTSLLLAAIDDINESVSPITSFTFKHASSEKNLKRAKEFLELDD